MKQSIVFGLLAVVNAIDNNTYKFMQYLSKFGKSYSSIEEFNMRLSLFIETDKFIEEWSADTTKSSTVSHNVFSDWTPEQRSNLRKSKVDLSKKKNSDVPIHKVSLQQTIPATWNWTA
jgi:hypothetical protein